MTNAAGIVEKMSTVARRLMDARRDMSAVHDELQALGVDLVLEKLVWEDELGNPVRAFTRDEFKAALGSVEEFNAFMTDHEARFYRIAS